MAAAKNVVAQTVPFVEVVDAPVVDTSAGAAAVQFQKDALAACTAPVPPVVDTQAIEQRIALAVARAEKAVTEKMAAALAAANAVAANAQAYASKVAREAAAKHAASVQPDAASADMAMIEKLMNNPPSGVRVLVGFILAILSSFTVGYGIGMLLAYALAGITTLVGAGLAAFMLSAISWVIAIYAAWKVGSWVGGKVFSSVVMPDGLASVSIDAVSNTFSSAKSTVTGWFKAKPVAVVAAPAAPFTGAHAV